MTISNFDPCKMSFPDDPRFPVSLNSFARKGRGLSQLQASMPTTFTPFSVRNRVLSRSIPAPLVRYSGLPQAASAPVCIRTMSSGWILQLIRFNSFSISSAVILSPSALWRKSRTTPLLKQPIKRNLVDCERRFSLVHGWMIMIGGIQMCSRMSRQR